MGLQWPEISIPFFLLDRTGQQFSFLIQPKYIDLKVRKKTTNPSS